METRGWPDGVDRRAGWIGWSLVGDGLRRGAMRVLERLLRWQELASQRRRLAEMDDRMLRDLGLSRADVEHEARRPFWDDAETRWS